MTETILNLGNFVLMQSGWRWVVLRRGGVIVYESPFYLDAYSAMRRLHDCRR